MLLVDTQILVWITSDSPRLGSITAARIKNSPRVFVSSASIMELTLKSMLGKLSLRTDQIAAMTAEAGFLPLAISHEDAQGIGRFPELTRHDPFDRLLVSQAYRAGLTLITSDPVLLALGRDFILDGRE